uniref:Tektin n=1 Tax=Gongylonema pulchrum TaxID=637853 RepID=A0A183DID9_9BILA
LRLTLCLKNFKQQQFIKASVLAERDLIGEHIDGCFEKVRYIQEQIVELQKTIASVDNKNAEVSCFFINVSMKFGQQQEIANVLDEIATRVAEKK